MRAWLGKALILTKKILREILLYSYIRMIPIDKGRNPSCVHAVFHGQQRSETDHR